jgi:hypothetical protein
MKPTHGKLVQTLPSGKTITLADNQPWAILQDLKKEFAQHGVPKEQMKIKYL